jgi:hypothetical protein
MGNPFGSFVKNGLEANLPEVIRSFAEYSYVLKAKNIPSLRDGDNLVAEFDLLPGSWILFAKSTLRAPGPDGMLDVQLTLSASENGIVQVDRAKASVANSRYSTVALLLGARFLSGGKVKLVAMPSGIERNGEVIDTVLAAVKTDKLLMWDL